MGVLVAIFTPFLTFPFFFGVGIILHIIHFVDLDFWFELPPNCCFGVGYLPIDCFGLGCPVSWYFGSGYLPNCCFGRSSLKKDYPHYRNFYSMDWFGSFLILVHSHKNPSYCSNCYLGR